jgi:hypothetical protein
LFVLLILVELMTTSFKLVMKIKKKTALDTEALSAFILPPNSKQVVVHYVIYLSWCCSLRYWKRPSMSWSYGSCFNVVKLNVFTFLVPGCSVRYDFEPANWKVYEKRHCVIKFVSVWRQVGRFVFSGFLHK